MKKPNDVFISSVNSDVFKLAVKSAFNHIIITDVDGTILYANSAVERITGYNQEETIGNNPRLWGQQMPLEFYQDLWKTIKKDKRPFSGEIINKRKNGEIYIAQAVISPVTNDQKDLIGFIGTEEDITKAKLADKMKTEFISITAHQLKTPLTAMRWYLDLLEEQIQKKSLTEALESISFLKSSNASLVEMVNELLNVTRLESGRVSISPKLSELNKIIESCIKQQTPIAKQKNIRLKTNLDPKNPKLRLDEFITKEVINNLLSNAIKYTPENKKVMISTSSTSKFYSISVEDEGIGIPKLEQKKIFKKYYRSINAKSQEGTGLGLYFTKLAVDAFGGKITFTSEESNGSTFTVLIPKSGMKEKKGEISLS